MNRRNLVIVLSTLVLAASAQAAEKSAANKAATANKQETMTKGTAAAAVPSSPAAAMFEKLKGLAGTWTWQKDGKPVVALQTRVSSGNSAIIETMFPGMPHEMTNIYTLDGDAVLVTHYCASGNQPRMAAGSETAPGVLKFALRDATGVDLKTGDYMGELTLTMVDTTHLVHEWRNFTGGKPGEVKRFEFTRQKM